MKARIAVISPAPLRPDTLAWIEEKWFSKAYVSHHSYLNDASPEVASRYPPHAGEPVLMLGLSEGNPIPVSIRMLIPGIENLISETALGADFIFYACAGDFPKLKSPVPIIQPALILRKSVAGTIKNGMSIGVITPGRPQVEHVQKSWQDSMARFGKKNVDILVEPCKPNLDSIEHCIHKMAQVNMVAVECLRFDKSMGACMEERLGIPVILAGEEAGNKMWRMIESACSNKY